MPNQVTTTTTHETLEPSGGRGGALLLGTTLFLSGFCGIAYEVLYSRLLGNLVGDHFAVNASILLTFLLGIGLGSKFAHRLHNYLWAVEGAIGLYAVLFVVAMPAMDRIVYTYLPVSMGASIGFSSLVLAIPSALIGVSLPLFAAYLKEVLTGPTFGIAYMVYNFGAAATAILIEFQLLRSLGIRGCTLLIASINGLVCLLLVLWRRNRAVPVPGPAVSYPWRPVTALVLVSLASAVFQLLALKLAEFIFGPYNETFAMVIAIVLLGIALGTAVHQRFQISFRVFALANAAYLTLLLLIFQALVWFYAVGHDIWGAGGLVGWKFFILLLFMGVPAACFGAAIPATLTQEEDVARESGYLLFVSSLANATGYLLMIFVLHPLLDYGQMLLLLVALLGASAFVVDRRPGKRALAFPLGLCAVAGFLLMLVWNEGLLYLDYGAFSNTRSLSRALRIYDVGFRRRLFDESFSISRIENRECFWVNGYRSIALGDPAEYNVGVLSSLPVRSTQDALVLGLGSGSTASTVAAIFDHVDAVEISPVIVASLDLLGEYNDHITTREHVTIVCDDGIRFMKRTPKKYDLILNTVTTPLYFSSSKLYTVDFLRSAKSRLKPGGVYTTWLDTRVGERGAAIILKGLQSEFKYCWLAMIRNSYFLLLCSNEPLALRQEEAVFSNPALQRIYLEQHALPIEVLRYAYLSPDAYQHADLESVPFNRLDLPVLEFEMSRLVKPSIAKFRQSLYEAYTPDLANQAFYSEQPLDWLDLLSYHYRVKPESPWSQKLVELGQGTVPNFKAKLRAFLAEQAAGPASQFPTSRTRMRQAEVLCALMRFDEAEEVVLQVLKEDPDDYFVRSRLGWVYFHQRKFNQAREVLEEHLALHPADVQAMYWLGRTWKELHNYKKAIELYTGCLGIDPWLDDANYNLGVVYQELGEREKAQICFRRERLVDPLDEDARGALRSFRTTAYPR